MATRRQFLKTATAGGIAIDELPEEMRSMDAAARKAYVATKAAERASLQTRIKELSAKRAGFVKKKMAEGKLDDSRSLDRALRDAIRSQATKKGFKTSAR